MASQQWSYYRGYSNESSKLLFPSQNGGITQLQLENDDDKDQYRLVDLENLRVEALLLEVYALTTDEKIDEVSQKIRRFAADLEP